jgi:hypothetical protein
MAEKRLKIWYDKEGDFLEVMFEQRAGHFRETANPHVMEKARSFNHAASEHRGDSGSPARRGRRLDLGHHPGRRQLRERVHHHQTRVIAS